MRELLRDPLYRSYFLQTPKFPFKLALDKPWRVWADVGGEDDEGYYLADFRKKDFPTFAEAFAFVKPRIKKWDDFAITSRIIGFVPPKPVKALYSEDYDWCIMCRRPTLFEPHDTHHALRDDIHRYFVDWPICIFCGSRENPECTKVKESTRVMK